jgi:hypothetical protein
LAATFVLVELAELVALLPELLLHPAAKPSIAINTRQLNTDQAFRDFLNPTNRSPAKAKALIGTVFPNGESLREVVAPALPCEAKECAPETPLQVLCEV